jgi:hypothetical protein
LTAMPSKFAGSLRNSMTARCESSAAVIATPSISRPI